MLHSVHNGHSRHGKGRFEKGRHRARVAWSHGKKLALVLDIDETSLSNYTAINADNFTFGPQSQAEATKEIGTAIAPRSTLQPRQARRRGGVLHHRPA